MKTFRLRIAGIGLLSTAMIVLVGVFWLTKPQEKQAAKPAKSEQRTATNEEESNQKAGKLYQMALRQKNATGSSDRKYMIMAEYCRQVFLSCSSKINHPQSIFLAVKRICSIPSGALQYAIKP